VSREAESLVVVRCWLKAKAQAGLDAISGWASRTKPVLVDVVA
jgi:hypothetical protein